jgi:hypothetical protein
MSNYRRGADLERALVRHLRSLGWEAARSASSKSAVDVWAVRGGDLKLFQCSLYRTAAKERSVAESSDRLGFPVFLVTKDTLATMEHGSA